MAENNEKSKSGAGKFFLGALIGVAIGAVAGKIISSKLNGDEEEDAEPDEAEALIFFPEETAFSSACSVFLPARPSEVSFSDC